MVRYAKFSLFSWITQYDARMILNVTFKDTPCFLLALFGLVSFRLPHMHTQYLKPGEPHDVSLI